MSKNYVKKVKEIKKEGGMCLHCEEQVTLKGFKFCDEECAREYNTNKELLLALPVEDEVYG